MYSKILILNFPPREAQKPLVCQLTKKYDLLFNILLAKISNQKEGYMVLEITGEKANFKKGVNFLKDQDVRVSYPEQEIWKDEEKCTQCGSCTAVCPTEALHIKRPEMEVLFDKEKCSLCELCILTCPTRAMGLFSKTPEEVM
ncbi:MAG: 4Fe-4S dicluster domain-containing protein [Desulfobacteraceae bacterium]|nr:4Fe-4S dicluster domain-containing protein [Desulfobacteraceae bacterium]